MNTPLHLVICLAQEHNVHGDPSKDRTPTSESEALTTRPPLTPVKVVIPIFATYKLVSIRFNHSSIIMRPFSQTNMEMHVHV